jgi:hypothetical protein
MATLDEMTARSTMTGWIAALWSGEYDKTQGALKGHAKGFCVQGVLLDQMAREDVGQWRGGGMYAIELGGGRYTTTGGVPWKVTHETIGTETVPASAVREAVEARGLHPDHVNPFDSVDEWKIEFVGQRINDYTDASHKEMGHMLYDLVTEHTSIDLPPKDAIMEIAGQGPCGLETADETAEQVEAEAIPA